MKKLALVLLAFSLSSIAFEIDRTDGNLTPLQKAVCVAGTGVGEFYSLFIVQHDKYKHPYTAVYLDTGVYVDVLYRQMCVKVQSVREAVEMLPGIEQGCTRKCGEVAKDFFKDVWLE